MNWLFQYQVWLAGLVGVTLLRRLMIILSAEQGRKHDLVRKLYKNTQEHRISVLIPFLDITEYSSLLALLRALAEQNYPTSKVTIHLVSSSSSRPALVPQALRYNVRVWECPDEADTNAKATSWLIDRCLAQGGSSVFVFLRATDMVKPDFFRNVAAKILDTPIVQGYVALKNTPRTLFDKASALTSRLFNRIDNAGRSHLGMSCRLLDSGWALKQEILEMIPYRRGTDLDNLEYTIRLNLENFRVTWAPNMVIYGESHTPFMPRVARLAGMMGNRARLMMMYGPLLLTRILFRFNRHCVADFLAIFRLPSVVLPLALVAVSAVLLQKPAYRKLDTMWFSLTGASLFLQVLGLWVARCRAVDFGTLTVLQPLALLAETLALPVGGLFAMSAWMRERSRKKQGAYRRDKVTRFNENIQVEPSRSYHHQPLMADESDPAEYSPGGYWDPNDLDADAAYNGPYSGVLQDFPAPLANNEAGQDVPAVVTNGSVPDAPAALAARHAVTTSQGGGSSFSGREIVRPLPLSNGKKQVECLLRMFVSPSPEGHEMYRLTLEYKNIAFSTSTYRILDQAFYELHAKLVARGLTPVACGSCGYFYNPTADRPGVLKNTGVCLQGKLGREVNLNADAVTVISPACQHHCPLEQREQHVNAWKDSLAYSISPKV